MIAYIYLEFENQNLLIFIPCAVPFWARLKSVYVPIRQLTYKVYRNVCEKSVAIIFPPNKNIVFNNLLIELFALSWFADYNELLDLAALSKILVKS